MQNISNAAMARIFQQAVVESVNLTVLNAINQYMLTLSTEGLPQYAIKSEAFQKYRLLIDRAAHRSASARAAAARRRESKSATRNTAATDKHPACEDSSIPSILFPNLPEGATNPDLPIVNEIPEGYGILGKIPGYYILSPH